MALILRDVATSPVIPDYKEVAAEPQIQVSLTASLGTVPDYSGDIETGVLLGGVRPGQAAEAAGIQRGDIVLELAGKKIDNIYDYTYAIDALKVGETVKIKIKRGDEVLTLDITPTSKK
jgi:S1-C subfamily serine protease